MTEDSFIEFIKRICQRPQMYTAGGSLKETLAFIDGYRYALEISSGERIFERYICRLNSFPDNYGWTYVIIACSTDEKESLRLLEDTIVKFFQLRETLSDDELLRYADKQAPKEGEAEKTFRQFDKAFMLRDELLIKPLIEEHPDAQILWQEKYPEGVAEQLLELSANQPIKGIPIGDDGKKMKIIAPGWFFPIEMNFKDGKWKIDASKLIDIEKKRKSV
jgi:hypothetical protein